eukprot:TRINITY_DN14707_c0_g1_i1.p1 TRINITY_DN14707_c0_g1~~TRINITY_DN14707_c0_g1_i1.p1  ORF type:complete len:591 (-),score=263.10 TRINITY_DN14707_c0_g1_i1:551-2323(-)
MKLIDVINQKVAAQQTPFFSFEYFPPKTEKGVENLYARLDRMALLGPAWFDVTWGAGGSTSTLTLEICKNAQKFVGVETMMHMTCTNMPVEELRDALKKAREAGIQNILALRGDPPRGEEWKKIEGGFSHAVDLVRFIRAEHGDYFGIAVAGYPEGHIDATSYEDDMRHLKEKVDAGADFIVTQLFYDVDIFLKFVADARALGVNVPIIPGLMPIHTYAGFERMTTLCKTVVPPAITAALEPIKKDEEAVKDYGVKLCMEMSQRLFDAGIPGIHFYTLNLERSVALILEGINLVTDKQRRTLPWDSGADTTRTREDVRPIFWMNRPTSYISRTSSWDDFPNGRWGDSRSPAFGDLADFHLGSVKASDEFNPRTAWGDALSSEQDVFDVFANYCSGKIPVLPWSEQPLQAESVLISQELVNLNKQGFLTINSQPKVNGAPSNDEKVGWGPQGGYVFQKAYLEFFTSPENFKLLQEVLKGFPSIQYHAVSKKGEDYTNVTAHVCAITWGVFPNKEIIQPTVVDPSSFFVWKDEAFALWDSLWGKLYDEGSQSRDVIDRMVNSYYLVNVVDNNFVSGDIFAVFDAIQKLKQKQ